MDFLFDLSPEELVMLGSLYGSKVSTQGYNAVQLAEISTFFKIIAATVDSYFVKAAYTEFYAAQEPTSVVDN